MEKKDNLTIVLADDHAIVRGGLRLALEQETGFTVVAEAGTGKELIKLYKKHKPEMLIVDLDMPEMTGMEAIRVIREKDKKVKILVITMHKSEGYLKEALMLSVNGYIIKVAEVDEFISAVSSIAKGETYYGKYVSKLIMDKYFGKPEIKASDEYKHFFLSEREEQILKLIAEGYTSPEIGKKLHLSHYTIENHRKNMIQKTGVKNTFALVKLALEKKYISLDGDE